VGGLVGSLRSLNVTQDLASLYRAASYRYKWRGRWRRFSVGQRNPALDLVLRQRAARSWCFITASNPASRQLPAAANRRREQILGDLLRGSRLPVLPARGCGTGWPFEAGFVVLGASAQIVRGWAKRFNQNAVVWGSREKPAILVWTARA